MVHKLMRKPRRRGSYDQADLPLHSLVMSNLAVGYQCVYRSEDAANYVRATQGLDLLYAHRPLARRLLSQASERESPMGRIRIISVEGLNTFSYLTNQNFSMNSSYRNNADPVSAITLPIASAVLAGEAGLPFELPLGDMAENDPIAEWLSLMEVVQMLCPVWPVRNTLIKGHHFLL